MSIKKKITNVLESNAFFIVFGLSGVALLIYMDLNRKVNVTMCEDSGITTYFSRVKPPEMLKFGSCKTISMKNSKYYELKSVVKYNYN
jgi:hypothetical protein